MKEYDLLSLLFGWLVELAGFSGYSYKDALDLAQWVLSEIEAAFPDREKLLAQTSKFRRKVPEILLFLDRLQAGLERKAEEKGIPPEVFSILYL